MLFAIYCFIVLLTSIGILFYKLYELYVNRPTRPAIQFILMAVCVASICMSMVNMIRQ